MKIVLFISMIALLSSTVQATEYNFTYTYKQDKLEYKTKASNWDEAFKRGADFCFKTLIKREPNVTENVGLDIIDTCANPGEKK